MDVNGGPPRRLTDSPGIDALADWSKDGKWIYYTSTNGPDFNIWRLPANGGVPEKVTRHGGFQPQSALAQWFAARTGGAKGRIHTVMIVALARKLLVAPCSGPGAGLWRYVGTGEVPDGARLAAA